MNCPMCGHDRFRMRVRDTGEPDFNEYEIMLCADCGYSDYDSKVWLDDTDDDGDYTLPNP